MALPNDSSPQPEIIAKDRPLHFFAVSMFPIDTFCRLALWSVSNPNCRPDSHWDIHFHRQRYPKLWFCFGCFTIFSMVLFYFIQETGHYFGTRGHSFGTRRQIFETKFNYRTEGAVQRQSIVFYENRSGKSLKYDIISEHRDIISEQTTNFLKLTVSIKIIAISIFDQINGSVTNSYMLPCSILSISSIEHSTSIV